MIPRARPDTDPITLAIATASESANVIQPQTGYVATTAAQIHVHHFHHQSCQHHTDSVCVTLPHAASQTHPRSEDDYAVVFNSTNAHSPYPPALQPVAPTSSKHSNTEFVLPRKGVCTATIRHPSIAALCLHSPRPTMTCETNPPAHHIVQIPPASPSQLSTPHFFKEPLKPNSLAPYSNPNANANGHRQTVYSPTDSTSSQKTPPSRGHVAYLASEGTPIRSLGNPSVYYRLTAGYSQASASRVEPTTTTMPNSNGNIADKLLKWFRAGGGGGDVETDNVTGFHQRRRSKSQPPQRQNQQRIKMMLEVDPRCLHASSYESNRSGTRRPPNGSSSQCNAAVANTASATTAPNQYQPGPPTTSSNPRDLPNVPCSCIHHHTNQQGNSAVSSQSQRSRIRRWLFPCGPNATHPLSPSPFVSSPNPPLPPPPPQRCELPPPPPPRSNAIVNNSNVSQTPPRAATRSVEVQTNAPSPTTSARTSTTPPEVRRCGVCAHVDSGSSCCAAGCDELLQFQRSCSVLHRHQNHLHHSPHIMLHHYHFHHYYHCEGVPQSHLTPTVATTDPQQVSSAELDSRPASPLIKLSANWPPTAALLTPIPSPPLQPIPPPPHSSVVVQSPLAERPAPVSEALRAIESAMVETPTKSIRTEENSGTSVSGSSNDTTEICMKQMDQRRIFLQNINQLKRTGWYWGPLTIEEAELLLKDRPNGSFLVRDSGHELYILSVSFRAEGRTYHTRIEHTGGKFSFAVQGDTDTTSPSIAQFINHVIAESERGRTRFFLRQSALTTSSNHQDATPPTNVQSMADEDENRHVEARLLYPVSRFLVVHSLAHLCRFEILLKVRKDHIDRLPLPDCLKHYLHERQYYSEFVQAYLESVGHLLPNSENTAMPTERDGDEQDDEIEDHV